MAFSFKLRCFSLPSFSLATFLVIDFFSFSLMASRMSLGYVHLLHQLQLLLKFGSLSTRHNPLQLYYLYPLFCEASLVGLLPAQPLSQLFIFFSELKSSYFNC